MTRQAYITGCGAFLPGEPVTNDEQAGRLGGGGERLRGRVLAANGIRSRHYALDERGVPTMSNEELAVAAVRGALADRGLDADAVGLLTTGTTQGDLLVPGFASMVHGRLGGGPMETLSAGGVCASGMAALKAAVCQVRLGEHDVAVTVGSDLVSRSLRAGRSDAASTMDSEFLRWTLSDGAGAVVVEGAPRPDRPSLRVEWVHHVSHAHEHPVCMRAGLAADGRSWQDHPTVAAADAEGLFRLRQDVRMLPGLARAGLAEFVRLVRDGRFDPATVDHVLCHYSAEHFRDQIFGLLTGAGLAPDPRRWFTNLHTAGNTGAASIFVMLEECWRTGRFRPGEQVLLIVPESGRFSFSFALLTCVGPAERPAVADRAARPAPRPSPLGEPDPDDSDVVRWTVLQLAGVWADFDRQLRRAPIVRRIEDGGATVHDYRRLLVNLRAQVVDGGRWISRAASNFSVELFELRSAAIRHAAEEHRDYQLLEADYVSVGGDPADIAAAEPNIGSAALSAFVFQRASQPDPVDLLGAMFVIEGLGTARAAGWADRLQADLGLRDDQLRFLRYHGANDDDHFAELSRLLRSGLIDRAAAGRIVRTARVVARLYALQLEELDHV